jgi:hypothetical protein
VVEEERGGVPGWGENPLIPTQRERWLTRWKQRAGRQLKKSPCRRDAATGTGAATRCRSLPLTLWG